jgi:hypothetical protein
VKSSELFATLEPGSEVDLKGASITSDDVDVVPANVTITSGTFIGEMNLYDAKGLIFSNCTFEGGNGELHSLVKFLGGEKFIVSDCTFQGGVVMSQLGIGLNSRVHRSRQCPMGWAVQGCVFEPLDGQAGEYPQGHQMYCLTTPRIDMGATIEDCVLMGSPYGAPLKLGGTGNYWRSEGVKGITVERCDITGMIDEAGRILCVLTQGARTDVELIDCTLRGIGGRPWVQANDGARCRMANISLPNGVTNSATWYLGPFGLIQRTERDAIAGSKLRGGIVWS